MEPKEELNQDYIKFNQAIGQRAQEEIRKIRAYVAALKAQATKMSEALTAPKVSEKVS